MGLESKSVLTKDPDVQASIGVMSDKTLSPSDPPSQRQLAPTVAHRSEVMGGEIQPNVDKCEVQFNRSLGEGESDARGSNTDCSYQSLADEVKGKLTQIEKLVDELC